MTDETPVSTDASGQPKSTSKGGDEVPRPRRGRKPKSQTVPAVDESRTHPEAPTSDASTPTKPKRTYTRRKPKAERPDGVMSEAAPEVVPEAAPKADPVAETPSTPKPRRRKPAKKAGVEQVPSSPDEMTRITQEATHASSEPTQMPATSFSSEATVPSETTARGREGWRRRPTVIAGGSGTQTPS